MSRSRLSFKSFLSLALLSVLLLVNATQARAAAVWSVLSVQVEGDTAQWMDLVKQALVIRKNLGIPAISVVQATFAGDATGTYYVSTEYPSLTALGEASAKLEASAEWMALLPKLQASSKVVASSLYVDRTPAGAKTSAMTPGGYSSGIVVRVDGNPSAYLALLPKLTANWARLGVAVPRVWQATSAGTGTGAILITTAYPSMAVMEESQAKTDADPESQQLLREIEATGRRVVARLIVRDRTPR
jgi:hypothetical protein